MNIEYVSLTGADNKTDIKELQVLAEQYPTTEWAILMFPERDGKARNPTIEWRNQFHAAQFPNTALHLCGTAINKFASEDTSLMLELDYFKRVQINLKPQWATKELVEQLVKIVSKNPQIEFITQYNEANTDYFKYWASIKNHSYLFDGSLGKGLTPETWLAPVENKKCGYAGGLNPENVLSNIEKINTVAGNQTIWIDMETGLRTNDEFDIEKVKKVLLIVQEYNLKNRKKIDIKAQ